MGVIAAEFSWRDCSSVTVSRETEHDCSNTFQAAKCSSQKLRLHHLSKDHPPNGELDFEGLAPL